MQKRNDNVGRPSLLDPTIGILCCAFSDARLMRYHNVHDACTIENRRCPTAFVGIPPRRMPFLPVRPSLSGSKNPFNVLQTCFSSLSRCNASQYLPCISVDARWPQQIFYLVMRRASTKMVTIDDRASSWKGGEKLK